MPYGPNNGNVPFTGFTATLGAGDANIISPTGGNVAFDGMSQSDRAIASELFTGNNRVVRRLINALTGAAAGGTATETRTRIVAVQANNDANAYGGLQTPETINLINRATTAADVTNLKALVNRSPVPSSYAADVSGNGGGGRAGH